MIKAAVLTISDSCAKGERQDLSGPATTQMLTAARIKVTQTAILPDEREQIAELLRELADAGLDLIITTGGTGLGPRDVTPEATLDVVQRLVPGLMEASRAEGWKKTPNAILSRGCAGIRKNTLIVNLPGSERAVRECMEILLPVLPHAIRMMHGGGHD
jgi:molybdenum cofactor synthesis domain-containing protein